MKRFQLVISAIVIAGFVLLALNPFVLDFFSLARGYGLALACLMSSLYLLARAHEEEPEGRRAIYAFLSTLSAQKIRGTRVLLK